MRLGCGGAVVLQSIVCEKFAQGSYTMTVLDEAKIRTLHNYRLSALTNLPVP